MLVALGDDLEEIGAALVEREVAEFVNNEQARARVLGEAAGEGAALVS